MVALPSGRSSRVERIVTFDGDLPEATAPISVTLTLEDEIDISRGDLLVAPESPAAVTSSFTASLVWMDATPLEVSRRYLLKHTSRTVQARVRRLIHTVDLSELEQDRSASLAMNGIGLVEVETLLPLAADTYATNRHTGSFVLIDPQSNATVAAGMIRRTEDGGTVFPVAGRVTASERVARFGHAGAHVRLRGTVDFAEAVERALFEGGANVTLVGSDESGVAALVRAGLLVLTTVESTPERPGFWVEVVGAESPEAKILVAETQIDADSFADRSTAVAATMQMLRDSVLRRGETR